MTWPLTPNITHAGRLDSDDGRFSIWNVAWVARTLVVNPLGLYDANIFYPRRNTLAFSEANIGAGVLAIPAYWMSGGNPYFAHNVVEMLSFVLSLIGTCALVRHLTGNSVAGLVSGLAFAFCGYTFSHIPHIQLLLSAGLPISLLAMHRFIERQTVGRTVTLGLVMAAQALACGYYGIFAALAVTPGIVFYSVTRGRWKRWQYWAGAAAAGLLAIATVMPFFLPYLELKATTGFGRNMGEVERWSARWSSYLASPAWAHRWMVRRLPPWGEVLYPGTIALVLGVAGAFLAWRTPRGSASKRDHVMFYGALAVFMAWASLGPRAGLYTVFFRYVPVFTWISSPSRLGLMVTLALAVLAGFAAARLLERSRRPALVGAVLIALTIGDLFVAPLLLVQTVPVAAAYEALKARPFAPVAEFPFFNQRIEFYRHAYYMLGSTAHWRPLINGYSDFIPPEFREMVTAVAPFPNAESFAILKRLGVRYVVFHTHLYSAKDRAQLERQIERYRDCLAPVFTGDSTWLYEIVAWPSSG